MFPKFRRERSQLAGKANVCLTYPGHAVLPNVDAAYSNGKGVSTILAMSGQSACPRRSILEIAAHHQHRDPGLRQYAL